MRYGNPWALAAFVALCSVPVLAQQTGTVQQNFIGSGTTLYNATYPDAVATTAIAAAQTTQVLAGTANESLYLFFIGAQLTAAAGGNNGTIQWDYGTGATCTGSPTNILVAAIPLGSTSVISTWALAWSGSNQALVTSNNWNGITDAIVPLVIVSGSTAVNLCAITTGTVAITAVEHYAIR